MSGAEVDNKYEGEAAYELMVCGDCGGEEWQELRDVSLVHVSFVSTKGYKETAIQECPLYQCSKCGCVCRLENMGNNERLVKVRSLKDDSKDDDGSDLDDTALKQ